VESEQAVKKEMIALAARGGRLGRDSPARTGTASAPAPEPERVPNIALDRSQPIERQMVEAVRVGGVPALARLVEDHCGIARTTTAGLAERGGMESFAVLFRGLGAGFVGSMQLLLLVDRDIGRSRETYESAKRTVNRLDAAQCREFLKEIGARFEEDAAPALKSAGNANWHDAIASRRRAIAGEHGIDLQRRLQLRKAG
jgi:hypothetical protein